MIKPTFCVGLILLGAIPTWGQSVQLPQWQTFGTRTTVNVPDRGHTTMGGVSRAGSWETRGLGNRSSGNYLGTGQTGVSVYVHDFEALEQESVRKKSLQKRSLTPRDQTFSEKSVPVFKRPSPPLPEKPRRTISRTQLQADLNLSK